MSEYQYYEFLAIDRPLSAREMDHLRAVSTRARITPVSFVNEYNLGDFKGDSMEFMRRFFDAHVYLANWGEALFMVRLPLEVIDEQAITAFCTSSHVTAEKLPHHWLLTWSLVGDTGDYDPCDFVEETGWMARLAPLREELLRGDLRSLYIGWLKAVSTGEIGDDDPEPLALKGLGELTPPQQALAELLAVDQDLLAGVGIGNPPLQPTEVNATVVDAWLDQLPRPELNKYLRLLFSGKGIEAERELKRHYTAWQTERMPEEQGTCRPVATLRQLAEESKGCRLRQEAQIRNQAEAERKKLRENMLTKLAKDFPRAWKNAHAEADKGYASAYDTACRQLVDLRDAYNQQAMSASFQTEFQRFMDKHRHRKALMTRLVKAGLCRAN
ncbi:MAG: hypothetical protein PHI97_29960 [Desulfobulbus sp.]|nr:hypothetical protein [Desulfobulbus sp.]